MIFLSITCLGFRGGLYVMIMRQIFRSIPHELAEAAAVDGVGAFRTFIQIMVPLAKPMMTVVFLFSFSWQWTDTFYSSTLFSNIKLLPNVVALVQGMNTTGIGSGTYTVSILLNTVAIMSILPLIILFVIFQKKFVQGIERSGIVG
ncbi:MAG: ABC transporter permease subunit [Ruthenibacterium sp.]